MKKLVLIALVLTSGMAVAQVTKKLGDFDELKVFDRITVTLIPSGENKIEIKGRRTKDVEVVNNNGQLKVRMKFGKLLDGDDINATLYFTTLESVDASEGSMITSSTTFKQSKMEATAKEGAQIELHLDVDKVEVKSVTGAIVRLAGRADNLEAKLGTGGILEAKTLETSQADVSINAGGEAEVNASDLVDADVKAGGNVTIYGHPKQINKNTTLGGTIEESK
ncbi:MAG TPA: head GIN domain-containing protein [Flavobacterium sp.]|nr:head GIN domain-containing protein [Flavobacterium sp.]